MQTETTKLLIVKTDPSLPAAVDVSMLDLKDAILKQPDIIIDALRQLITQPGAGTTPAAAGNIPLDTPIFKMVSPDNAKIFTTRAKTLTKADLLAMQGQGGVPPKSPADLQLTVEDVKSITDAFHQQNIQDISGAGEAGLAKNGGISCCTCTPCCSCCAATVERPVRRIA